LSLHVATALVVRFFGKRAVELFVFHFTTALVHCLPIIRQVVLFDAANGVLEKAHGKRSD
jgi:hypothetical protein